MGLWEQVVVVAIAGLFEGLGVPWPGAVVVAGAGMAAAGDLSHILMHTTIFGLTYTIGALIQYGLGRAIGPRALAWVPKRYRTHMDQFLERYGFAAVLWSRPLAIGNYVSAPAGIMQMPLGRFVASTLLGIVPWALLLMLLGDFLGKMLKLAQLAAAQYLWPAISVLVVGAIAISGWRYLRQL